MESDHKSRQRRDLKARLGKVALTFGEMRSVTLGLSGAVQWCQQGLLSLFWADWEGPGCRGEEGGGFKGKDQTGLGEW